MTSLERGLAILSEIGASGDATVEEISTRLGIPPSTAYRYFKTLRAAGFLQDDGGRYRPGSALLELTGRHHVQFHLAEVGTAVLKSVVDAVGETAVMIIRVGTQAMCLRRAEPDKSLKYTFAINEMLPLHAGAGQRILLAWAPPDVVRQVLDRPLPRFTENTPTAEQVLAGLPQIRAAGRVVSRGELDPGAVSVAVPVFCRGEVVCSINVAGPESRCGSKTWINTVLKTVEEAARNLTESLESTISFQSTRELADEYANSN
ncbi:transcriptional regulator [Arthrobacter crystallopoietes BAB-32]|uniref:Transcriptional regulator n=1 Tax=Arthrobacter crystallopoietes BAB-32 TaxID=1246476 RepID=N1UZH0_9MICC|nr:IclR family transcriptional regulator [Arthrobacter crystallopoietes]EMY33184.1 transcriptional regulator [Arthrobacter crystallopoietes BAB-32]